MFILSRDTSRNILGRGTPHNCSTLQCMWTLTILERATALHCLYVYRELPAVLFLHFWVIIPVWLALSLECSWRPRGDDLFPSKLTYIMSRRHSLIEHLHTCIDDWCIEQYTLVEHSHSTFCHWNFTRVLSTVASLASPPGVIAIASSQRYAPPTVSMVIVSIVE